MVQAGTKLTLFVSPFSQPSRAVWSFCDLVGIEYELHEVNLQKGDQKKPEFLAINPQGAVPAIKESRPGEDDFILGESHAILRYLCDTRGVDDKWYPKDLKQRAKVDEYLDKHATEFRNDLSGYVFRKVFGAGKYTDEQL